MTHRKMLRYGTSSRRTVRWIRAALLIWSAALCMLTGCGDDSSVIYQISGSESVSLSGDGSAVISDDDSTDQRAEGGHGTDQGGTPARRSSESASYESTVAESISSRGSAAEGDSAGTSSAAEILYVYVCGAVQNPGVYQLPAGSRIYQAVEAAGGMMEDAESRCLNQAERLTDGQQVTVYTKEEAEKARLIGQPGVGDAGSEGGTSDGSGSDTAPSEETGGSGDAANAKVNLNTATKEQLMTLPGIGEARADAIIEYRTTSGGFSCIEDIQNISGIKEKAFEKIKDDIEV